MPIWAVVRMRLDVHRCRSTSWSIDQGGDYESGEDAEGRPATDDDLLTERCGSQVEELTAIQIASRNGEQKVGNGAAVDSSFTGGGVGCGSCVPSS